MEPALLWGAVLAHDEGCAARSPFGTFTFLFSDIEGSTKLLHELGAEAYAGGLLEHRRVLREAFARHGGIEGDYVGEDVHMGARGPTP